MSTPITDDGSDSPEMVLRRVTILLELALYGRFDAANVNLHNPIALAQEVERQLRRFRTVQGKLISLLADMEKP